HVRPPVSLGRELERDGQIGTSTRRHKKKDRETAVLILFYGQLRLESASGPAQAGLVADQHRTRIAVPRRHGVPGSGIGAEEVHNGKVLPQEAVSRVVVDGATAQAGEQGTLANEDTGRVVVRGTHRAVQHPVRILHDLDTTGRAKSRLKPAAAGDRSAIATDG